MMRQLTNIVDWATQDPIGRMVALGVGVVVALLAILVLLRSMKWAAARWKMLFGVAVALAVLFYAGMSILQMGPTAWIITGFVLLGGFFGFALFMTQGGTR